MRYFMATALLGLFLCCVSGCSETPSSPAQGGAYITFRTVIDNTADKTALQSSSHSEVASPGNQADSIEVTSAGLFVSNMLFFSNLTGDETDINRTEIILRNDHFILDFESWGKQYIGARTITSSTYRSIRFTMKPADTDVDPLSPLYLNFFKTAPGSTVVIRGNVWVNSQRMPFEYRSSLAGNELAQFDSAFTIAPGDPEKEVDVHLKTYTAFGTGTGRVMDPRDGRNAANIDANLRSSLQAIAAGSGS